MNEQTINNTNTRENINRSIMNEILNHEWAKGSAISHDSENNLLKIVTEKEIENNGEKKVVHDLRIYHVEPKSTTSLLFIASNTLGLYKEKSPQNLQQALDALKDANEKYVNNLTQEEKLALYERDFIEVPGHDWITRNNIFSKEKENNSINLEQEFAHA